MWAIEDSPGPKAAYRGVGIILLPAILLHHLHGYADVLFIFKKHDVPSRLRRLSQHMLERQAPR